MPKLFRAAKQNRIFQDVVEQIQEAIISGRLNVGDRLPAERELKEMLQTSRSTLREALRVLEQKGLIEIKLGMGGGALVKTVSSDQVSESLDLLIRSQKVSLNHIAEFREKVEGDIAAIAARKATKENIKVMKKLLENARNAVEKGNDGHQIFIKADKEIHLYFAQISENPIYISILKTIHDNINRYYDQYLSMEEREMKENLRDLENVIQAVENGRDEDACNLVRSHVRRFSSYMEKREKEISE